METHITICKIYSQWESANDSGNTNWGSVTPRGVDGASGEREVKERDMCIPKADSC